MTITANFFGHEKIQIQYGCPYLADRMIGGSRFGCNRRGFDVLNNFNGLLQSLNFKSIRV
jgi:hypothetical protein